jgi:serine/threonine protein kinase
MLKTTPTPLTPPKRKLLESPDEQSPPKTPKKEPLLNKSTSSNFQDNYTNYSLSDTTKTQIKEYFEAHPENNKYSRKINGLGCSFIKTRLNKIYAIHHRIGTGTYGYVRLIDDIDSRQKFALKIMAVTNNINYNWALEKDILERLNLLFDYIEETYPSTSTSSNDSIAISLKKQLTFNESSCSSSILNPTIPSEFILKKPTLLPYWKKKIKDPKVFPTTYTKKVGLIIKLIEGKQSLREYLKTNYYTLDLPTKITIILKIIQALKIIHAKNIVHNDLSPNNILIGQNNATGEITIEIIDFGCAAVLNENKIAATNNVPSFTNTFEAGNGYFAPESNVNFIKQTLLTNSTIIANIPEYLHNDIKTWALKDGLGFCSTYSDVYSLGCNIRDLNEDNHKFLSNLFEKIHKQNPYERPSLEYVEEQCVNFLLQLYMEEDAELRSPIAKPLDF